MEQRCRYVATLKGHSPVSEKWRPSSTRTPHRLSYLTPKANLEPLFFFN